MSVDAAGCPVVWHLYGDGNVYATPLVLLHGGHGSHLHWVRNVLALSTRRPVWVPDMPGFAESGDLQGDPHDPERLERLLDVLEASLDVLQVPSGDGATSASWARMPHAAQEGAPDHGHPHAPPRVAIAGFSFGGLVAASLAARLSARPGRLERLALLGPGGHGGTRRQTIPLVDWRVDDPVDRRRALEHNLRVFMLHDAGPADNVDALALAIHTWSCELTRFRSRALSRSPRLAPALDHISAPILLAWGEHDVTAEPPVIGAALTTDHPNRRLVLIPDAGHWVQYEQAETVNALLNDFLAPG